jgi:hypothetical protein
VDVEYAASVGAGGAQMLPCRAQMLPWPHRCVWLRRAREGGRVEASVQVDADAVTISWPTGGEAGFRAEIGADAHAGAIGWVELRPS